MLGPFITVCHCVAGEKALADAGIPYSAIEQACVGYVYGKNAPFGFLETTFTALVENVGLFLPPGDSTCGQRAIYHSLGLTGIPILNVNNNCSTGSTALFMARQLIQGGE